MASIKKPTDVTIKQIVGDTVIYGLGDDQGIYEWDYQQGVWVFYAE